MFKQPLRCIPLLRQQHQRLQRPLKPLRYALSQNLKFSTHSLTQNQSKVKYDSNPTKPDPNSPSEVRLSKRMSELGICSRREAAKILKETTNASDLTLFKQAIYLKGQPVTSGTGVKVHPDEKSIEIRSVDDTNTNETGDFVPYNKLPWERIRGDTIVLNKPVGYVSGQEEHQHVPAVRLLTPGNLHLELEEDDEKMRETLLNGSTFSFTKKKWSGFDIEKSSLPKHVKKELGVTTNKDDSKTSGMKEEPTLSGYAPAGRLDIDSTGLLIFTRAGIMARRLIAPDSRIPKEYFVEVQPAIRPTTRELKAGLSTLPPPNRDLRPLLKGGKILFNDTKPLKPLLRAEWMNDTTLRLVLLEGKKRQIRRMCREILGLHVVSLVRTSIGPVCLGELPEGKWRPLREDEFRRIFGGDAGKKRVGGAVKKRR